MIITSIVSIIFASDLLTIFCCIWFLGHQLHVLLQLWSSLQWCYWLSWLTISQQFHHCLNFFLKDGQVIIYCRKAVCGYCWVTFCVMSIAFCVVFWPAFYNGSPIFILDTSDPSLPCICHASFSTIMLSSWLTAHLSTLPPWFITWNFMDYPMMHGFSLKNQDQDTGSHDSIFAPLSWIFVVDSSAKYTKEKQKERRTLWAHIQLIHVQPSYLAVKLNLYIH